MSQSLASRSQFALHIAEEAEKIILSYYQDPKLQIERKRDRSFVTAADKNAELAMRKLIRKEFPEDSILGEEFGEEKGKSSFRWILDPVDGTQSFVCGVPLFGTLVGLTEKDKPVTGVVNFPALHEIYWASRGEGAWWRPSNQQEYLPAKVSAVSDPKNSVFCANSPVGFARIDRRDLFDSLSSQCEVFRGWGDCYGHMLVATGRAEIMIDPLMNIWDCAALLPIVIEAGGHFFDLDGGERIDGGSAVSTNSVLRTYVMGEIRHRLRQGSSPNHP